MIRSVCLAAMVLTSTQAFAQTGGSQSDGQRDEASGEEIIVRADLQARVVEAGPLGTVDILTTPYAVNSVTADTLDLRQTRNLIELQKTDPSAQLLSNTNGVAFIGIRGFPADIRLDGARTSTSSQFPLEFVERIDIVKGASSFLYGFVPPGGVVDYVLKRPGADAFVTATASYRTAGNLLGRLDINQPITPQLGFRLNALYENGESYTQDGHQRRIAVNGAMDWRPTDSLLLRADLTWQRSAPLSGGNPIFYVVPGNDIPDAPNQRRRYTQKWERYRIDLFAYGLRADWTFAPDWTLSARARGFEQPRRYYNTSLFTVDAGGALLNDIYGSNDAQNSYQQQLMLRGSVATGAAVHNLTFAFDRQHDPRFSSAASFFQTIDSGTFADPVSVPRPDDFVLPDAPRYRTNRTLQQSGTIADRIEMGPWTALLALRYVDFSDRAFDDLGEETSRNDRKRWTPTIGLSYRIGQDVALYANYAQGLEPGARPFPTADDPTPAALAPITSNQVEIGVKTMVRGLTGSLAVFHLKRDYQAATVLADGATPSFIADGKQVHTGVEATVSGMIAPKWNIIAGATYLDAEIRDATGFAINGDRPVGVAKFQSTIFVEHEIAPGFFANAGAFHASGSEVDTPNDRRIGGYTTVDGGLRWSGEVDGRRISVNATVENIFDERYWGGVYYGFLSLGVPRQFKLTVSSGF